MSVPPRKPYKYKAPTKEQHSTQHVLHVFLITIWVCQALTEGRRCKTCHKRLHLVGKKEQQNLNSEQYSRTKGAVQKMMLMASAVRVRYEKGHNEYC